MGPPLSYGQIVVLRHHADGDDADDVPERGVVPAVGLPSWLGFLTRINPLTYAVDPLRHEVFSHISANPALLARFNPGVTWFGWHVPPPLEIIMVLGLGMALLGAAIAQFRRTD